ncbi:MAG: DTW domain-containing protein [Polyangiaceae bacterium]
MTLVVPDGTWRQASKMRRRVPGLANVRCVALPASADRTPRLRAEAHAHGLSTLEAIARARRPRGTGRASRLELLYLTIVERTLWMRGALATHEVTTGIPEDARRESPRGGIPSPPR